MEEETNKELVFLDILLERDYGNIFVLIYRKPTHIGPYLHCSFDHQINCEKSVFPACSIEYIPLSLEKMT